VFFKAASAPKRSRKKGCAFLWGFLKNGEADSNSYAPYLQLKKYKFCIIFKSFKRIEKALVASKTVESPDFSLFSAKEPQ